MLASSIFLSGLVGTLAHDVPDAVVFSARELAESASASASPSLSVTVPESGAALLSAALASFGIVFAGLEVLLMSFPALGPLLASLQVTYDAIYAFFVLIFGKRAAFPKDIQAMMRNKADDAGDVIDLLESIVDDLVKAREDPMIGTGIDGEICDLVDIIAEIKMVIYGEAESVARMIHLNFVQIHQCLQQCLLPVKVIQLRLIPAKIIHPRPILL